MDDTTSELEGPVGLRGYHLRNPERSESRRQEVLTAAARIFARDGYDAATLDAVAEAIGATKAVIYYYFRGKEDLYNQIRATATYGAIERLQAIIARRDPPDVKLHAAVTDLVQLCFNDIDHASIVLGMPASLSARSRAQSRERSRQYSMLLRAILEEGIQAGLFVDRDVALTAFIISRACLSVALWYKPGGRLSASDVADQVIDQVLVGILHREGLSYSGSVVEE